MGVTKPQQVQSNVPPSLYPKAADNRARSPEHKKIAMEGQGGVEQRLLVATFEIGRCLSCTYTYIYIYIYIIYIYVYIYIYIYIRIYIYIYIYIYIAPRPRSRRYLASAPCRGARAGAFVTCHSCSTCASFQNRFCEMYLWHKVVCQCTPARAPLRQPYSFQNMTIIEIVFFDIASNNLVGSKLIRSSWHWQACSESML